MASCDQSILKNILICVWCNGDNDSPLLRLDCYHLACRKCLSLWCKGLKPWSIFECPKCHAECTIPEGGVQFFPVEILQSKLEILNRLLDNDPDCDDCYKVERKRTSAECYCRSCQKYLCLDHGRAHHNNTDKLIRISETNTEEFIIEELKAGLKDCELHSYTSDKPEKLKFYCKDCKSLICRDCRNEKHAEHRIVALKEAGKTRKMEIQQKREEIKSAIKNTKENIQFLEEHLEDIQENKRKTIADIKQWQDHMIQLINNVASKNIEKVEKNSGCRSQETKECLDNEERNMAQLENNQEFAKAIENFCSDKEILEDYKTFEQDLNSCLLRQVKIQISANHFSIVHKDIEEIKKSLKECFGEVLEGEHRIEIQSLRKKVELVECREMTKWKAGCNNGVAVMEEEVVTVGGNKVERCGVNGKGKDRIPCQKLKNAWNVEYSVGKIFISDKEKKVVWVLDETGKVVRDINLPLPQDQPLERLGLGIDKSNGNIFIASYNRSEVYKCTETDKSARPYIKEGLNRPHYICISSKHEVIASNLDSNTVCKFSRAGDSILWEYSGAESGEQLKGPYGVCVDDLDNVFIADYYKDRIHYVSSGGKFIRILDISIRKPMALTFARNNLIITNVDSSVYVYKCYYE